MSFLCGRPGCGTESVATLQIDALSEAVSLVDPRVSRDGVPLCAKHADSTTPPVGWTMNDLRSSGARPLSAVPDERSVPQSTPPRVRPAPSERSKAERPEPGRSSAVDKPRPAAQRRLEAEAAARVTGNVEGEDPGDAPASRPSRRRNASEAAGADEETQGESFPWHYEFEEDDEPNELKASSPLLSRAFRSTTG